MAAAAGPRLLAVVEAVTVAAGPSAAAVCPLVPRLLAQIVAASLGRCWRGVPAAVAAAGRGCWPWWRLSPWPLAPRLWPPSPGRCWPSAVTVAAVFLIPISFSCFAVAVHSWRPLYLFKNSRGVFLSSFPTLLLCSLQEIE